MTMLHAFLDESGTNPETPVLSVGGFYGTKEQWEIFRWLWRPYSTGFHATRSTRLFPQLCSAIECSRVRGVLLSVGKETYKSYASTHLQTAVGNAYSICALCYHDLHTRKSPAGFRCTRTRTAKLIVRERSPRRHDWFRLLVCCRSLYGEEIRFY